MRPIIVCNDYRIVKAFFNFLIAEELIDFDSMRRIKVTKEKTEIKSPVPEEEFEKFLRATKRQRPPAAKWRSVDVVGYRTSRGGVVPIE
jgi:integrase